MVRPAQQGVEPGPNGPAHPLRHDFRDGLRLLLRGLFHKPDGGLVPAVLGRGGGHGGELFCGEVHHLGGLSGLWAALALGAVFRQDLVHGILPSARLFHFIGHGYSPYWRCLTASYSTTAAAAEALRELSCPFMGMDTRKSHCSRTRRPMPSPSLPMTMAAGPFRSAS